MNSFNGKPKATASTALPDLNEVKREVIFSQATSFVGSAIVDHAGEVEPPVCAVVRNSGPYGQPEFSARLVYSDRCSQNGILKSLRTVHRSFPVSAVITCSMLNRKTRAKWLGSVLP